MLLNLETGRSLFPDPAMHKKFLLKFIDRHGQAAAEMRAAGVDEVRALAHKLVGAASQLGLDEVGQIAREIERRIMENPHFPEELIGRLEASMQEAIRAIKDFCAG